MTNRLLTYIAFLVIFLFGMSLPHLISPHRSFVFMLEEIVTASLFALGCVLFLKPVRRKIQQLNESHPWKQEPKARLIKELNYILSRGAVVGLVLFLVAQVFIRASGMPKMYEEILTYKDSIEQIEMREHTREHPPTHHRPPRSLRDDFPPPLIHPIAKYLFGGSFLLFFLLFSFEELFDFNDNRAQRQINNQKLLKEQALMEASILKKQLNPHFMFNSLNVLSGLVREDVDKSERFIQELAEIYRYVLEQSEVVVSSLKEEQDFIESYFYLLKIRFEEKLVYSIDIPADKMACQIPSMTLEVLVENAVKHNILDKESPLNIKIYLAENTLVVENNLQIREDGVTSHGVGLSNLQKRLDLLDVEGASFGSVGERYIAHVPLIC